MQRLWVYKYFHSQVTTPLISYQNQMLYLLSMIFANQRRTGLWRVCYLKKSQTCFTFSLCTYCPRKCNRTAHVLTELGLGIKPVKERKNRQANQNQPGWAGLFPWFVVGKFMFGLVPLPVGPGPNPKIQNHSRPESPILVIYSHYSPFPFQHQRSSPFSICATAPKLLLKSNQILNPNSGLPNLSQNSKETQKDSQFSLSF